MSNKRNILTKCFRVKVAERIKKSLRGLILTSLIALSWVGTLHLLKLTYNWNQSSSIMSPSSLIPSSSIAIPSNDDLIDSTLNDDEDDFEERLFNVSSSCHTLKSKVHSSLVSHGQTLLKIVSYRNGDNYGHLI